ncbi:hypothetical protein D1AOALGA4SA_11835 [Olavius algarvensis Delta 1 endosymbiont]|nr:hypothetical protein D1AOALGA4SA_11835 [Olavius algarvensis Delta 1 endosymbiont]
MPKDCKITGLCQPATPSLSTHQGQAIDFETAPELFVGVHSRPPGKRIVR